MTSPASPSQNVPERFVGAAFDALSANVAILDAQGVIVAVNGPWRDFARDNGGGDELGVNYLRVCASTRGEDVEARSAREVAAGIRAVLAGETGLFELEYPCHSPTEQRWFVARVTRFEQDGEPFVVVAHQNVTRRKLAELALLELNATLEARVEARTRELEEWGAELAASNRDLEQFAYLASHDLQEPLRMVSSYADLLRHRYTEQLDERANLYLGHLLEGTARMRRLIQDVLALSRVGSGPPRETVDVARLFDELRESLPELRDARVSRGDLPSVHASPSQLRQVLTNLLGNAAKFRSGQALDVSLRGEREGQLVHFVLRDNGIGIAPEHAQKVFGMFQRLHGRTRFEGDGIGLTICQKIVERHGGRIWVESERGQGADFHFTLPAGRALT